MILHTARLILRRAEPGDLDDLHGIFSQPRAMRYWTTPAHQSRTETAEWLARMLAADPAISDDFVIEHRGRVIGKAGAWRLPEVGFMLHPDLWGRGLAREAMVAVIDHLFASYELPHLTAEADPRNAASLGLLARLGFQETHRAVRTLLWGDEWCDSVYLALAREDWPGLKDR